MCLRLGLMRLEVERWWAALPCRAPGAKSGRLGACLCRQIAPGDRLCVRCAS